MFLVNDEAGLVQGIIYTIMVVVTAIVLIIALGPVMHLIQTDMFGTLEREDTIFVNNEAGWNSFSANFTLSELIWEMSFIFFIFLAIVYMIVRAIKRQSYTQYDRV